MLKKKEPVPGPQVPEWDPNFKELWHMELEKEAINDERWTCMVTAAIPSEGQDEECIEVFGQCADTGLRRAINVINMKDIVNLLKKTDPRKEKGKEGKVQNDKEKKKTKPIEETVTAPARPPILNLAAKYATFTDVDCKLPPDLMAAVLKHVLLNLKSEKILEKKKEIAKEKRARKEELKRTFIRDQKPFEMRTVEQTPEEKKIPPNPMDLEEAIDDEPFGGPDLYILLAGFHNPLYFSELVRVNVPFAAIIKITGYGERRSQSLSSGKVDFGKPNTSISGFWETLKKNCLNLESTARFQDIALMQYHAPSLKHIEAKSLVYRLIFDQLSWMQYSTYFIYRQHQTYLRELYVQRSVLSLETLDLSKCDVYNKLCDALITGEPNSLLLIFYAVIEQVVAGVPETESVCLEYEPKAFEVYSSDSESGSESLPKEETGFPQSATPYYPDKVCKRKNCPHWKTEAKEDGPGEKDEGNGEGKLVATVSFCNSLGNPYKESSSQTSEALEEDRISSALISQVLSEKKTEKESRSDKKWKSPKLYFYGDALSMDTYHCDPRLLDSAALVDRFLTTGNVPLLWSKYPVLPPEERAFYNYHFHLLLRMSRESREVLKLKLFLSLCMKLIGMSYDYLYRGEEEELSSVFGGGGMRERMKKLSRVHFGSRAYTSRFSKVSKAFPNYFVKTFIEDLFFRSPRKSVIKLDNVDRRKTSLTKEEFSNLRKFSSQFNVHLVIRRSSKTSFPVYTKTRESSLVAPSTGKISTTLHSLLDCFEFPSSVESHISQEKEEYIALIQKFSFFEKLEPRRMLQRLMEANESYNTTQTSYFAPTDTLIVLTHNDSDFRGIFSNNDYGVLPTPVTLRDFYHYVYPEISDWLIDEEDEFLKTLDEVEGKKKEEEDASDKKYLSKLKAKFCAMSEREREAFLESEGREPEPETEKELKDLPKKPRLSYRDNKVSFVATNFTNVRVEAHRNVQEYYSRDGTEVRVTVCTWLYSPSKRLTLEVKRSGLRLIYHKMLETPEAEAMFSLITSSDIIFVFYKNDPESYENPMKPKANVNYFVKISWPTGLMIEGVPYKSSNLYVKQGYIKVYRKGWDIENEKSRCCLRNGQIIIFKDSGGVEVLCPSGTKHVLHEVGKEKNDKKTTPSVLPVWVSKWEWTTTTGEVWEKVGKATCKKRLVNTHKIYIGVDWKAQEIYYRREDGVSCMVWPNGKLVTTFPDGTKITSIPNFDKEEIVTDWTEEEKLYFSRTEFKSRDDQSIRSRAILRNPQSRLSNVLKKTVSEFQVYPFVSVSCSYLMEHPKYSTIYFDSLNPSAFVKMPEEVTIKMEPEGNYEVVQRRKGLRIYGSAVEFYKKCSKCEEKSTASFTPDSKNVIFKFTDFNLNVFLVQENWTTRFHSFSSAEDENLDEEQGNFEKTCRVHRKFKSVKSRASNRRCFALERDLSGYEFFHANSLATQCYHLPPDTHYELNVQPQDDPTITHTFSCPFYRIGYEDWRMEYEDKDSSLPTNLKKKDLAELGVKEPVKKARESRFAEEQEERPAEKPKTSMPKVVVTRIVKSFSSTPKSIIDDMDRIVNAYQKRARDICAKYATTLVPSESQRDSSLARNHLKNKALKLNQNLNMYPHLGTYVSSIDREIHHAAHFINLMECFKYGMPQDTQALPDCKQIPCPLPRLSNLNFIYEDEDENLSDSVQ